MKTAFGQNSGVTGIHDSLVHTLSSSGTGNIQCTNGYNRTQALTTRLNRKQKIKFVILASAIINCKENAAKIEASAKARKRPEWKEPETVKAFHGDAWTLEQFRKTLQYNLVR